MPKFKVTATTTHTDERSIEVEAEDAQKAMALAKKTPADDWDDGFEDADTDYEIWECQ